MKKKKKESMIIPKPGIHNNKIRMLMSLGTARRPYFVGSIIKVGEDVSEETALNWINCGVAEIDKSMPGPPEIK